MSKKLFVLFLAAAAVVCFTGSAMALTQAHQATATGATQGDCSACHIPHKAAGAQRLFPIAIGNTATYGFMGGMCAEYCHNNDAVAPLANSANTALFNLGAAGGSHGMTISRIPPQSALPTTLPYLTGTGVKDSLGGTTAFECTTCHNPHKNATGDTSEALLQLDIDAICQACHTNRGTGNGVWGATIYGDLNNVGGVGSSHPVGTDVFDDESQSNFDGSGLKDNSPIFVGYTTGAAGSTVFDVPYGASRAHNLGGHLLNGVAKDNGAAAITCATCHAVHGNMPDSDPNLDPDDGSPFEDLLAVDQGSHAVTYGDAAQGDGNGQATNALCNGCHQQLGTVATAWNPGATAYSHPCDGYAASADMGAITAPAGWPVGTAPGTGMDFGVICETCHDPHVAAANSHILRQDELVICNTCHTATPTGHHPVGASYMTRCGFSDAIIGDNDADLECSDCHNGAGAHNWSAAGAVGLDPDWEPYDNGRSTEPADGSMKVQNINVSKECVDCHQASTAATFSPTCVNDRTNMPAGLEEGGEGSHYLGAFAATYLDTGRLAGATFNAETGDWNSGAGVAQSRYAGTAAAPVLVCESCHELEINRKDNTNRALLLYDYEEMKNENASELCQGCHNSQVGAGGTHPLTGQTVSKAFDAGRSPVTLITATTGYANAATAPGLAEYPAADIVNCDSCHQPHDTQTIGGTFILEGGTGVVVTGTTTLGDITLYGVNIAVNADAATSGIQYQTLCTQCHAY